MPSHSLVFCPDCGTLLDPPTGTADSVVCDSCSGVLDSQVFENVQVTYCSRPGVFGEKPLLHDEEEEQEELRKSGATIQEKCPKCDANELIFHFAQLRSADEGQTIFYRCVKCGHKYSVNS